MSIISTIPNEAQIQMSPWEKVGQQIQSVFLSAFGVNDVYIDSLQKEYSSGHSTWYTIQEKQAEIIGWLQAICNPETQQSCLAMIAVSRQWQKQGMALKLIQCYIEDMRKRSILTITSRVRVRTLLPMLEKNFVIRKKGQRSLDLVDNHWYQQISIHLSENPHNTNNSH